MEWFNIDWKGPFPIATCASKPEAKGKGIYAIYEMNGKSFAKLIYIGETFKQSFGKRLKQHEREWLWKVKTAKIGVCFGTVHLPRQQRFTLQRILDIESFLIHDRVPPFNQLSKHHYKGRDILIFHAGKIGLLDPIMTDDDDFLSTLKKHGNALSS
jgi:hypothetical protein